MKRSRHPRRGQIAAAVAGLFTAGMLLATPVGAQLSTANVRGQITVAGAPVRPGLEVVAINKADGRTYRTRTAADGTYALIGLAPGNHEIRITDERGQLTTQVVTLAVGESAAIDLALPAPGVMERVTIVGALQRKDVKTSEVGTSVSRKLIDNLPQVSHNFLSSADLAPGVAVETDANGFTRVQSGSQNFDHVNVFIDGVGQKNNILRGGLTGQDSSRGNPFPQSAIAEYKVITQNYKAEYEQVSSAAITAITKSGTNDFRAEAYADRTGTNWRAKTVFEEQREAAGIPLPDSSKNEFGVGIGGPIRQDQLHYFFAYDGKQIDDSRQVQPRNLDRLPAGQGIVPTLAGYAGSTVDTFREHLLFGRFDAQLSDVQKLTASFKLRRENDHVAENRELSAPGNDKDRANDETRFDFKHEWAGLAWLSEARIGYEDAVWNPRSRSTTPFIKYKVSTATPQSINNAQDVVFAGGSPDAQRRQQKGPYISEDLTFTGLPAHVIKGGIKLKAFEYDLSGTAFSVDTVDVLVNTTTGLPYYDGTNCTGTNVRNNGAESDECRIRRALPPARASFRNTQIGLYIQDDWAVTRQLELNLGVRYDYETNMLNNDFVTPADRVNAIFALDTRTFPGQTPDPGQTYAQSLAKGGINISEYIATGSSRKPYKRAIAPRLGASYDILGDRNTVVFAGWGRSFDRAMANHALDELQKNQQAGGEIWLIKNDFKMPFADQYVLGLRQGIGAWNAEVALSRVHAKNQFVWFLGNRDLNGGFANQSPIDPLWGGPAGFGSLILGDFVGETRTDSLFLKAEKPYGSSSPWGVHIAYTYSDAQTTHREWNNDIFDFTFGKPGQGGWKPSTLVDKHRVVGAAVADVPFGITLSVKGTWASGKPRRIVSCAAGFSNCITVEGDAPSFRQVDLSASKELAWGRNRFSLRFDVFNVFDTTNFGSFDDWGGGPVAPGNPANAVGGDNLNLGKPLGVRGDPRTVRIALGYRW